MTLNPDEEAVKHILKETDDMENEYYSIGATAFLTKYRREEKNRKKVVKSSTGLNPDSYRVRINRPPRDVCAPKSKVSGPSRNESRLEVTISSDSASPSVPLSRKQQLEEWGILKREREQRRLSIAVEEKKQQTRADFKRKYREIKRSSTIHSQMARFMRNRMMLFMEKGSRKRKRKRKLKKKKVRGMTQVGSPYMGTTPEKSPVRSKDNLRKRKFKAKTVRENKTFNDRNSRFANVQSKKSICAEYDEESSSSSISLHSATSSSSWEKHEKENRSNLLEKRKVTPRKEDSGIETSPPPPPELESKSESSSSDEMFDLD